MVLSIGVILGVSCSKSISDNSFLIGLRVLVLVVYVLVGVRFGVIRTSSSKMYWFQELLLLVPELLEVVLVLTVPEVIP